jgi:hypothetical protein
MFVGWIPNSATVSDDDQWELVARTNNQKVYTRLSNNSSFKEVKILGNIQTNLATIQMALNTVDKYQDWVYNCMDAYKIDDKQLVNYNYYSRTDMPFPFSDRDIVVSTKHWEDNKGVWYSESSAKPQLIPNKEGVVRIQKYVANWSIKAIDKSNVSFEYRFSIEPGGKLPAWIINIGITKAPIRTIQSLEQYCIQLEKE